MHAAGDPGHAGVCSSTGRIEAGCLLRERECERTDKVQAPGGLGDIQLFPVFKEATRSTPEGRHAVSAPPQRTTRPQEGVRLLRGVGDDDHRLQCIGRGKLMSKGKAEDDVFPRPAADRQADSKISGK